MKLNKSVIGIRHSIRRRHTHALLILTMILLVSCAKDKRLMYQEDPRIYFTKYIIGVSNADSTIYSFSLKSDTLKKDTVYITMRIIGSASDKDRVINIMPLDSSTARKGYHYDFGPLIMPANQYQTNIPVIIYRKPGLKDSIVNLVLTVGTSPDFKPGFDDIPRNSILDRLHYKISITDQLLKPGNWDSYLITYFGAYSRAKFQFMIQQTGKVEWTKAIYPQDLNFLIQTVKLALTNYESANGPLLDENGVRITFPA